MQNLHVISGNNGSRTVPEALIHGVRSGVVETFEMICGEVSTDISANDDETSGGIVGMMSFTGHLPWSLMLLLPQNTAVEFSQLFCGMEVPYESSDMGDIIGELTNVVSGPITAHLEKLGFPSQMSLPTVARGTDVQLLIPADLPVSDMCFAAKGCKFGIKIIAAVAKQSANIANETESSNQASCQSATNN